MKFLIIFLLSLGPVLASEVAVLESNKTLELQLVLTDESLAQSMEKIFLITTKADQLSRTFVK